MSEETAAPEPDGIDTTPEGPVTAAPKGASRRARVPAWLPLLLAAIVPAVIVGAVVFLVAGNGSGDSNSGGAGVLDGFFRLDPSSVGDVESYKAALPPDFPKDFPVMDKSKIVASFELNSDEGVNYFVVLSGNYDPQEVYDFYLASLDKTPWQVEIARAGSDFTGVRFSRPDNPDVQGDLRVHHSDLDDATITYVSFEDIGKKSSGTKPSETYTLPASRALPPGFPSDIPIYKGKSAESVVTDTYFERRQGGRNFIVSYLTKDSQGDVLSYYRDEFGKRGWNVSDGTSTTSRFAISIDFNDGNQGEISGSVRADAFEEDSSYTQIDLVLQVSGRRSPRGN
jgi:hypothetical protein